MGVLTIGTNRLRRFLVREGTRITTSAILPIHGSEARHIINVLRLREGDEIELIDGKGTLVRASIKEIEAKRGVVWVLIQGDPILKDDRSPILLLMSMIKGDKMDLVIRKATECGVWGIVPVVTHRSVPTPKSQKRARWNEIALQALKQSKGLYAPEIFPPIDLRDLAHFFSSADIPSTETRLLLSPGPHHPPLLKLGLESRPPWAILVGPEGGLDRDEEEFLFGLGFRPVRLGSRILRAETAAIVAIGTLLNCQEKS